jgi:cytochrome c553
MLAACGWPIAQFFVDRSLAGFLILPNFQRENAALDLWAAICRAAGITEGSLAYPQPTSAAVAAPVSQVAWSTDVFEILNNAAPERGADLARQVCAAFHGDDGVSAIPEIPGLVGQSSAANYRQLHDYRSGARADPQMTPVAQQPTVPALASLAVFYRHFSDEVSGLGLRDQPGDPRYRALGDRGRLSRQIPACDSCHVHGYGGPIETPVLTGRMPITSQRSFSPTRTEPEQPRVPPHARHCAKVEGRGDLLPFPLLSRRVLAGRLISGRRPLLSGSTRLDQRRVASG